MRTPFGVPVGVPMLETSSDGGDVGCDFECNITSGVALWSHPDVVLHPGDLSVLVATATVFYVFGACSDVLAVLLVRASGD